MVTLRPHEELLLKDPNHNLDFIQVLSGTVEVTLEIQKTYQLAEKVASDHNRSLFNIEAMSSPQSSSHENEAS